MSENPPNSSSAENNNQVNPQSSKSKDKFTPTFYGPEDIDDNTTKNSNEDSNNYSEAMEHLIENMDGSNKNNDSSKDLPGKAYEEFYFNDYGTSTNKSQTESSKDSDGEDESGSNESKELSDDEFVDRFEAFHGLKDESEKNIVSETSDENIEMSDDSSESNSEDPNEPDSPNSSSPKNPKIPTPSYPGGAGWGVANTEKPIDGEPKPLDPTNIVSEGGEAARKIIDGQDQEKPKTNAEKINTPIELILILNEARNNYADLTAIRRGETLNKSKQELEQAKLEYEEALSKYYEQIRSDAIERYGWSEEEARNYLVANHIDESKKLMEAIAEKSLELSSNRRFAKVYRWFGEKKGIKARVDVLAAAAVSTPIVYGAQLFAGKLSGALLGVPIAGAIGAYFAKKINRSYSKENQESSTTAETSQNTYNDSLNLPKDGYDDMIDQYFPGSENSNSNTDNDSLNLPKDGYDDMIDQYFPGSENSNSNTGGEPTLDNTPRSPEEIQNRDNLDTLARSIPAVSEWLNEHPNQLPTPDLITSIIENTTREKLRGNRIRAGAVITASALAGLLGAYLGNRFGLFGSRSSSQEAQNTIPTSSSGAAIPNEMMDQTASNAQYIGDTVPGANPGDYPWDWAERLKPGKGSDLLTKLILRARENGVNIGVHEEGGPGTTWLSYNGKNDTQTIVNTLKPFMTREDLI